MASRTTTDPIEILLEMGVDLDNLSSEEDYLSALMEAVNILTIKDPTDPRIAPLQLEVRNVRKQRKAADPKFKEKKTKITADGIRTSGAKVKSVKALPTSALVPYQKPKAEEEKEQKKRRTSSEKSPNLLANIAKNVSDIVGILKQQYTQKQKASSSDRKKAEQAKRKLQESKLEKSFNILGKAAEKMIAPVKSLLERIFDFFLNIFIGRFLVKFLDWFGDPENQNKVNSLVRFFADHGPKLLAAYLLFGTRLGRFVTRLSVSLIKGAAKLTASAAKFAVRFAAANPKAAAITAIVGTAAAAGIGAYAASQQNESQREKKNKEDDKNIVTPKETREKGQTPSGSQLMDEMTGQRGFGGMFSGGGKVNGSKGTDKIPAMLTDGEFVMSPGAVQKYGVDTLESMNAAGGGTNRPKVVDNTVYASVGGYVGGQRANRNLGKRGTPDPNGESSKKTSPSIPSSAIKPRQVLALKNGVQGKLNPSTGKFTPKAFTDVERSRYIKFGGKIPESSKKPERGDFPMGRSGAKKYQESLKSFKVAAATSKATPAPPSQATKRHAEVMKSTSPQRIADYDAKHGAGAYSKKLQEKMNKIYTPGKTKQLTQSKIVPTGKVVGRENLSPKAQKALARLDAQKADGKTPDMQYTRNGKKISAEQFNKVKSGDIIPGGGKPGGLFSGMFGGMFGGMGKPPAPAPGQKVVDGNIGKPTTQEQRDIDALNLKKEKLKQSEQKLIQLKQTQPKVAPPPPPSSEPKINVIPTPVTQGGDSSGGDSGGGSEVDAKPTGNGNENKFKIFGISMPF